MKLSHCHLLRSTPLPLLLLVGFAGCTTLTASAQAVLPSPKIMEITREYVKPYKEPAHMKSESAYADVMAKHNSAIHYIASTSLSGSSRALFMASFDSFAAVEAAHKAESENTALATETDRIDAEDAELLTSSDRSAWMLRDDLSLNPGYRAGAHYYQIGSFVVKPGHMSEWEELVKLVIGGYKKGVPEEHWGAYQGIYGQTTGTFLIITSIKSAAELDSQFASDPKFVAALGPDGMKKLQALESSCLETRQENLFLIQPSMSYPPDVTVQANPDFWKKK
jgi:hypothetical protein